jgi:hypothetical protein
VPGPAARSRAAITASPKSDPSELIALNRADDLAGKAAHLVGRAVGFRFDLADRICAAIGVAGMHGLILGAEFVRGQCLRHAEAGRKALLLDLRRAGGDAKRLICLKQRGIVHLHQHEIGRRHAAGGYGLDLCRVRRCVS